MLAISVAAIGARGLNLGIEYEGGTKMSFATAQPVSIEDVRVQAERIGQANAQSRQRKAVLQLLGDVVAAMPITAREHSLRTSSNTPTPRRSALQKRSPGARG